MTGPREPSNALAFQGTQRFQMVRRVGVGGMGVVYEAHDRERDIRVALKVLPKLDPAAIYLFKQEFRSVANIIHPNLVLLYELFAEEGQWFYTMDFIDGVDFLHSVLDSSSVSREAATLTSSAPTVERATVANPALEGAAVDADATAVAPARPMPSDPARIRSVLCQVVSGLLALHAAGKLHRDIKPSNVMVTTDGRAVVLDFGLAAEVAEINRDSAADRTAGTAVYMSPEQTRGEALSAASDWYSVGVMLYEALTGQIPFTGSHSEMFRRKMQGTPFPPRNLAQKVPEDLDKLCLELLQVEPGARPPGDEILKRLQGEGTDVEPRRPSKKALRDAEAAIFVGRDAELATLEQALNYSRRGRPAVAMVRGVSGIGKSSLVRYFTEQPQVRDVLFLRGRCYEQESVPYKAMDSAIDALSRYLKRIPESECARLLPHDVAPLTHVFPVLLRAVDGKDAKPIAIAAIEPRELRRRAFQALRDLFQRLCAVRPVALLIDDLQWGDADSAALLLELMAAPDPPPLLFIFTFRSEYEGGSACLRMLADGLAEHQTETLDITLGPLQAAEGQRLAEKILGTGSPGSAKQAARAAAEASGNPFFIQELAHSIGEADEGVEREGGRFDLDAVIWKRVEEMSEDARRLLETIAISGRPLAQLDAYTAAGFHSRTHAPLAVLRNGRMVRSTGGGELDELETYHDRVRETVVHHLSAETTTRLHLSLATTLESSGRGDAETLGVHCEAAGLSGKAGHYFDLAGERAQSTLAFDRATQLFRKAIRLAGREESQTPELHAKLANALANAGRGVEAATEFEFVAARLPGEQGLEMERQAAFHYCSSGKVDEGKEIFRRVLSRVGLRMPESRNAILLSLLWIRMRLVLQGLKVRERPEAEISRKELNRIDAAWSVAAPFNMVDLFAGMYFSLLGLWLALRAGEPVRMIRAIFLAAHNLVSLEGRQRGREHALQLIQAGRNMAARFPDRSLIANMTLAEGAVAYISADWRTAGRRFLEAEAIYSAECTGVRYELGTARTLYLYSLQHVGEFAELIRRTAPLMGDAQELGDLYTFTNLEAFCRPMVELAMDRPQAARQSAEDAVTHWSQGGYHLQHAMATHSTMYANLYEGTADQSLDYLAEQWREFKANHLHRVPTLRILWKDIRARTHLAVAAGSDNAQRKEACLRVAENDAKSLGGESAAMGKAFAKSIFAGLAVQRGDCGGAVHEFDTASRMFQDADMVSYAMSARRLAGELMNNSRGEEMVREAEEWMARQKIKNPQRMAHMHVGGFPLSNPEGKR